MGLALASLRIPDLARWRISRDAMIGSSPTRYRDTAAWAKAVHDQLPDVEGLVWTSNRCDPDSAWRNCPPPNRFVVRLYETLWRPWPPRFPPR